MNVELEVFPKVEMTLSSGRVYPRDICDKALKDAVANHIPVKVAGMEDYDCADAGFVQDYLADSNKMIVTLNDSIIGKMVARTLQQPNPVVIYLAGIGYTDESQTVTDFKPTHGCVCERIR